jgi:glycosyltransferase involved in cell wall biosynthesis
MTGAMFPAISVVVAIRDRSGVRLENCLQSLRWQEVGGAHVEIVLSDLGSTASHLSAVRELAATYGARLVETPAIGLFNKSRALNIGIRASRADIVLCTDVDMIFETNFLSTILDVHTRQGSGVLVLCKCWDLPPLASETRIAPDDFPTLKAAARIRATSGTGACQAARRSFFETVRGYDEKYAHWGFEDSDMLSRACRYGLKPHWISDRTSMLHQWHLRREYERWLPVQINRFRRKLTQHVVVKNKTGWGV